MIEIKRYQDIVAFRNLDSRQIDKQALVAFHSRNMEVAEITEELWDALGTTNFTSTKAVGSGFATGEAYLALRSWLKEESDSVLDQSSDQVVRSITINITQICNLHCTYCAAGGDGTYGNPLAKISIEKTLPQLVTFIQKLAPGSSFKIVFLGGEPLLYPEAMAIIGEYVTQVCLEQKIIAQFSVVTNGTLMTPPTLEILKNLKAHVTVSIDGPPEINDILRPQKNGTGVTSKVIDGIQALIQNKSNLGKLTLHGVFSNKNMEMVKAYQFYKQFAVDAYDFTLSVEGIGQDANQQFMEEISKLAEEAYKKGGQAEIRKIEPFANVFKLLDNQVRISNHCGAGKSYLVIDALNRIYTCPWDVGSSSEQIGRGDVLDPQKLAKYKSPLIDQNNCSACWARHLCGGGCMYAHKSTTGSKNIASPLYCERTRFFMALALIYYQRCQEQETN